MMKPTMLYVSPFWPQRSGISEYSETLVWGLKEFFDIEENQDDFLGAIANLTPKQKQLLIAFLKSL